MASLSKGSGCIPRDFDSRNKKKQRVLGVSVPKCSPQREDKLMDSLRPRRILKNDLERDHGDDSHVPHCQQG